MSKVKSDSQLVNRSDSPLSRVDEMLVEMSNGCICCTLREGLQQEMWSLARERRFDNLLIGSTDFSEPLLVAITFDFWGDTESSWRAPETRANGECAEKW